MTPNVEWYLSTNNPDAGTTRRGAASRLAMAASAVALALGAVSALFLVLAWDAPPPRGIASWEGLAVPLIALPPVAIISALIAHRRPENPYGWLLCAYSLCLATIGLGTIYGAYALATPNAPLVHLVVALGDMGWLATVTLLPFLLLLFPTGRPPSSRWRWAAWGTAAVGAATLIAGPVNPGRFGVAPIENPLGASGAAAGVVRAIVYGGVFTLFGATLLSVVAVVVRFRRARGVERQQLKWFAYAVVLLAVSLVFSGFLGRELPGIWHSVLDTLSFTAFYAAIGIAVLRYRLYEIDRIINRTLVYGSLTAVLGAAYVAVVTGVSTVAGRSDLTIAAATLAVAALFQPLRARVQGFIDRRFYRSRYDAARTVEGFSARLRDEIQLEDVSVDLLGVVRTTLRPSHASLWLRPEVQR